MCHKVVVDGDHNREEPSAMKSITIGLDLAKHVFQVHGVDEDGNVMFRRRLRRSEVSAFFERLPSSLVGMEACSSAHYWADELRTLGHEVRLMPPSYVKPYVKRGKNDAADAEAICEAVTRPTMRFVPVKSPEQQSVLMLHRTRDLLIRQRTMLANAFRAHLSEFGIIAAQGIANLAKLAAIATNNEDRRIPPLARTCLLAIIGQLADLQARIGGIDRAIHAWHRANEASRRLETIPGVGPITASAIAATITDPTLFASGRHLAAWFGLVPRQNSSGGKERLGRISKQGDPYIRRLLVVGAHAVLRYARGKKATSNPWMVGLLARRPYKVAAVALANKMARIAWAILTRGEIYRRPVMA
jgi:transposase